MYKHNLVFVLFCLLIHSIQAQKLERAVLGANGQSVKTPNLQIDWTLGELAVATLYHSEGMLTEGFHQPQLLLLENLPNAAITKKDIAGLQIRVLPNPVKTLLQIQLHSDFDETGSMELINSAGQILQKLNINFNLLTHEIDMSAYPSGLYLLRFCKKDGEILKTYKIQKI